MCPGAAAHGIKVKHYVPPTGKFVNANAGSSRLPAEPAKIVKNLDPDVHDRLVNLLLSPDNNLNVFATGPKTLIKMLNSHHIAKPADLTIAGARHALLSDLVTGACIATCDPVYKEDHSCACMQLCSLYPSQQAMSFAVISILLSASHDRLPDIGIGIVADCMGWEDHSRSAVLSRLSNQRRALVHDHSSSHTARTLFEQLHSLPKGTLMSIAQAHGIFLENATSESLREAITQHVGMGMCVAHEGFAPFLGCSSLESEFPPSSETGSCNDPSVRLQIQLLRQLMPVLKTRPLRRLLELHDVSYLESDNAKNYGSV